MLPQSLYSPDHVLSDYHLFLHMKIPQRGRKCEDNEDTNGAVIKIIGEFLVNFFEEGLEALQNLQI